jgi:phosphate-selective porin OprO/OprP
VFSSVRPKQPWGAVELAIRYSGLDLTDEGIRGGDAQDVSLGINWYVLRNFRAMFNYVYADTRVGGSLVKDRPHIFQFRIQANL